MNSWMTSSALRRLSGSVFSGYSTGNSGTRGSSESSAPHEEPGSPKAPSPEQAEAESTMAQFLKNRRECIQRRKEKERKDQEDQRKREEMELRRRGPEDGFSDVQCHDISPPRKSVDLGSDVLINEDPDDVIQELELIHFLLTELNQRKDKKAPVKELRGYLMMFYSNLITFIRNRDEPLTFKYSSRNEKKSAEEKFDEKFLQVIEEYIKGDLFWLSPNRKELFLTKGTVTQYHLIEDKMCKGLEIGLRNKVLEMLKMANSCLSLHQILEGVRQNHQYLVSLRLKTIGAVKDFLINYPRDFTVVEEMVCLTKDSSVNYETIPPLGESPPSQGFKGQKSALKRSVSFADPSFITPRSSSNVSSTAQPSSVETAPLNAKAAFSKKSKIIESPTGHGPKCVCDKLSVYKFAAKLCEEDFMLINQKCLIASFMLAVQEISKKPEMTENVCQTIITFDPKEDL